MSTDFDTENVRWRRRKDARPHEIVAAATDLFTRQGFAATRVEEIAARAGITPGTVYRYFESKEAVLKAVVYESMGGVLAYAHRRIDEYDGDSEMLLRELAEGWWELFAGTRLSGIPKLMLAESGNFPELAQFYVVEVIDRGLEVFRRALERGIERGEIRAIDTMQAARLLMAPLQYATIYEHSLLPFDAKGFDREAYLETYLQIFTAGLGGTGSIV